jgi:ABC-type multidrug transport system fused ATPase/permease subunit
MGFRGYISLFFLCVSSLREAPPFPWKNMFLKNIARILANFRLLGWIGVAGIASTLLSQAIILTLPQISQRVIDTIDRHGSYDTLFYWCAWLAGAGLAFVAVNLAHYRLGDYIWGILYFRKNLEYKSILLKKNYAVLLQYGTGKLISRMSKGVDAETNIYYAITSTFLESVVRITAIVVILGYYSAWFALGFVGIFVGISCVQSWLFRLLRPVADAIDQTDEDDKRYTSRIIMENFLIRVSNRTDYEIGNIERSVGPLPLLNLKYTSYAWSLFHVLELGFRLLEAGMFLWFGWISIQGGMPLATVAMLSTYLWLTWGPIENMLENIRRIGREYESYARMQDVLNDPDVYSDGEESYRYGAGHLKFENVSFGYSEGITVLDKLSLDIE